MADKLYEVILRHDILSYLHRYIYIEKEEIYQNIADFVIRSVMYPNSKQNLIIRSPLTCSGKSYLAKSIGAMSNSIRVFDETIINEKQTDRLKGFTSIVLVPYMGIKPDNFKGLEIFMQRPPKEEMDIYIQRYGETTRIEYLVSIKKMGEGLANSRRAKRRSD